jgi:hypothetical protein
MFSDGRKKLAWAWTHTRIRKLNPFLVFFFLKRSKFVNFPLFLLASEIQSVTDRWTDRPILWIIYRPTLAFLLQFRKLFSVLRRGYWHYPSNSIWDKNLFRPFLYPFRIFNSFHLTSMLNSCSSSFPLSFCSLPPSVTEQPLVSVHIYCYLHSCPLSNDGRR